MHKNIIEQDSKAHFTDSCRLMTISIIIIIIVYYAEAAQHAQQLTDADKQFHALITLKKSAINTMTTL